MKTMLMMLVVLLFNPVWADEAALYDPEPPADASFVRVLNATDDATLQASLNNQPVTSDAATRISDYYVKEQGEYTITADTLSDTLSLDAGKYYTIALHGETVTLFEDMIMRNPAKAGIYVYNMTDEAVSLSAPKFNAAIFDDVAPGQTASREINAVTFDIAATSTSGESKTLPAVALKRRQGTSIILIEQSNVMTPIVVVNAVNQ